MPLLCVCTTAFWSLRELFHNLTMISFRTLLQVHYTGAGYGAYPFWLGGDGDGGGPAAIEVWWSEAQAAEKFYHSTCYMSEAGYDDGSSGVKGMQAAAALSLKGPAKKTKNVEASTSSLLLLRGSRHLLQTPPPPPPGDDDDALPPPPPGSDDDDGGSGAVSTPCYNLMTGVLGSAKAYLYAADESFCCVATGNPEDLSPPQSNFMDDMTLTGEFFCPSVLFASIPFEEGSLEYHEHSGDPFRAIFMAFSLSTC